jgi:hypothetical protein
VATSWGDFPVKMLPIWNGTFRWNIIAKNILYFPISCPLFFLSTHHTKFKFKICIRYLGSALFLNNSGFDFEQNKIVWLRLLPCMLEVRILKMFTSWSQRLSKFVFCFYNIKLILLFNNFKHVNQSISCYLCKVGTGAGIPSCFGSGSVSTSTSISDRMTYTVI